MKRLTLSLAALLMGCHHVKMPATLGPTPPVNSTVGVVAFDLRDPRAREMVTKLGVGVIRGSCMWEDLEPQDRVINFDCLDGAAAPAFALCLRPYLTITGRPNGGRLSRDGALADWRWLMEQVMINYGHTNAIIGVWNEPSTPLEVHEYTQLFAIAAQMRDQYAPHLSLAGPEVSHHALANGQLSSYLPDMERFMKPQDIISVHWYNDGPPLIDYLSAVRRNFARPHDLWLSETGRVSDDEEKQARFYTDVLGVLGLASHIIFYRLWDGTDCCSEAILYADYQPKPAFAALQSWVAGNPHP